MPNFLVKNGVIIQGSDNSSNINADYVDTAVETMGVNLQARINKKASESRVREIIGEVASLTTKIVDSLPISSIATSTIYLIRDTSSGANIYKQWMYILQSNGTYSWESIGNTQVDLSNLSSVARTGNYDNLNNTPIINGSSSSSSTSIFAPTASGTDGYILKSNGSSAPSWDSFKNLMKEYVPKTFNIMDKTCCSATCTDNDKKIYISVSLPYPYYDLGFTTVTTNITFYKIRSSKGYVLNVTTLPSDITVEAFVTTSGLTIVLTNSNGWTAYSTNATGDNTALEANLTGTITFA